MTERREFANFTPGVIYLVDGADLNAAWKVSCMLCAGEMASLSPDRRRDLGQWLQAALERAVKT